MLEIDACVLTHTGKVRTNNEDAVSLVRPNDAGVLAARGLLALLADGMGGHEGGELASRLALDELARSYYNSGALPPLALAQAFQDANREIYRTAAAHPALRGMGTTCVAVALCDGAAWWGWIGDSRIYLMRGGRIYRMSEDHTVVQDMVRRGLITRAEAGSHADRSVLERALGTRPDADPGLGAEPILLAAGDRLLLCSDGLHDLIADEEMAQCAGAGPVAAGAEELLRLALERGGHDNVSILLLEAKPESAAPRRPPVITREHAIE